MNNILSKLDSIDILSMIFDGMTAVELSEEIIKDNPDLKISEVQRQLSQVFPNLEEEDFIMYLEKRYPSISTEAVILNVIHKD